MQVLVALYQAGGAVVSRDELIARCWDGRVVGEDAINRAIGRLRRLSEADDGASFQIDTIARVGYRMRMAADKSVVPYPPGAARRPDRRVLLGGAAGIVAAGVAGASVFALRPRPATPASAPSAISSRLMLQMEMADPGE